MSGIAGFRRSWIVGVIFGALVAAVAVGAIFIVQDAKNRQVANGAPPLIRADPTPVKQKPETPGGLQVPYQDKLVYERILTDAPPPKAERLLPRAEQPITKPRPKQKPEAAVKPRRAAGPVAKTPALPAQQQPTAKPTANSKAPTAVVSPAQASWSDSFRIQLASYREVGLAKEAWGRLSTRHAPILDALEARVEKAVVAKKGTFYRLVAGPFRSATTAQDKCDRLKLQKQDCLVVKPR